MEDGQHTNYSANDSGESAGAGRVVAVIGRATTIAIAAAVAATSDAGPIRTTSIAFGRPTTHHRSIV